MRRNCIRFLAYTMVALFISSCSYNTLQLKEEAVFKAWADIESNLQRRADLIPNLVETVKGYAKHEQETLKAVVNARAQATSVQVRPEDLGNAAAMKQLQTAQGNLTAALSRLMLVVERYPDLKASQNFLDLQNQLEVTENRINVARQRYNQAVEAFNGAIRKFPDRLTNQYFLQLERKEYFKAEAKAKDVPQISF